MTDSVFCYIVPVVQSWVDCAAAYQSVRACVLSFREKRNATRDIAFPSFYKHTPNLQSRTISYGPRRSNMTKDQTLCSSTISHPQRHNEIPQAAVPSSLTSKSELSFLGKLDALPLELLHAIFLMLDFRTLSRLSRTCLRGVAVIESLPQYRDLTTHAPRAVGALGATRIIR